MSFSDEQIAALKAPLNSANVKHRSQAGRSLSYIEGWKAIDEANRVFGFDAWDRQTLELKPVCEPYQDPTGKWRVGYMARVRVSVKSDPDVINRDGCGFGSGIDKDLGQAHESALKEAETDAMKRALMTFGNPFGLALYDKEQRNVVDEPATATTVEAAPSPPRSQPPAQTVDGLILAIKNARSNTSLQAVIMSAGNIKVYEAASEADQDRISVAIDEKRAEWVPKSPPKANGRAHLIDDEIPF